MRQQKYMAAELQRSPEVISSEKLLDASTKQQVPKAFAIFNNLILRAVPVAQVCCEGRPSMQAETFCGAGRPTG